MKEIIEKIIRVETEAKQKVEAVKQEAVQMVLRAEAQARELKGQELDKANKEKEELLAKSGIEALDKKRQAIENASKKAQEILTDKSAYVVESADKIFLKVLGK